MENFINSSESSEEFEFNSSEELSINSSLESILDTNIQTNIQTNIDSNNNIVSNEWENNINPEVIQSQTNFNFLQENVNEPYLNFNRDIEFTIILNPLIFFYDFDKYSYFNIGKKVLAPKYMLNQLSKYDNLEYPIHIEINNKIFTIHDFIDDIDCIFIPTENFYNLNIQEYEYTTIKVLKKIPSKATYLKIKPCSEKFYELQNIKTYLEIHFKKLYPVLEKDEVIRLPYGRDIIEIIIKDCNPENIVSMNEIEELEIDFEPLVDLQNIDEKIDMNQTICCNSFENQKQENINQEKEEISTPDEPKVFVPFSGKGRRLCD